jgi:hypothetical protein
MELSISSNFPLKKDGEIFSSGNLSDNMLINCRLLFECFVIFSTSAWDFVNLY